MNENLDQYELQRLEQEEEDLSLLDDDFEDDEMKRDESRVNECTCGAWQFDREGRATLIADCIC